MLMSPAGEPTFVPSMITRTRLVPAGSLTVRAPRNAALATCCPLPSQPWQLAQEPAKIRAPCDSGSPADGAQGLDPADAGGSASTAPESMAGRAGWSGDRRRVLPRL